jgi:hypothetical protein
VSYFNCYTEFHYDECHIFIILLNIVLRIVTFFIVIQNFAVLSVVLLLLYTGCHYAEFRGTTESDIAFGASETMMFLTFLMKINRSPMKRIEMMSE